MDDRETQKAKLIARYRRLKAEISQYFIDVAYWNRIRPDAPIDPDPDGEMAEAYATLDRGLRSLADPGGDPP